MASSTLRTELKRTTPFETPHQEALLNLMRTYGILTAPFARLFKQYGITDTQYNVLRILRGAGRELPCSELSERMLTRVPDITRLVDRLVQAKLVVRRRSRTDRRVVLVRITESGRDLLAALDEPVRELRQKQLAHMSVDELATLNDLLVKVRTPG